MPLHQGGVVSAEPEIECLDVDSSHAALLIASDGVWNQMSTAVAAEEIMKQLRLHEYQEHLGTARAVMVRVRARTPPPRRLTASSSLCAAGAEAVV